MYLSIGDVFKKIVDTGRYNAVALMQDKRKDLQPIGIRVANEIGYYQIESFSRKVDENGKLKMTNYMSISKKDLQRYYLDLIFSSEDCLGKGLASNANKLAEQIMKHGQQKIIFGWFNPGKYDYQITSSNAIPQKEYNNRGKNFYIKNGYDIITLKDFLDNPQKYPLTEKDFLENGFISKVIVKKINHEKDLGFQIVNGVMVKDDVPKKILDELDKCSGIGVVDDYVNLVDKKCASPVFNKNPNRELDGGQTL